jgi:amino acid adenylation domain-containing protein
VIALPYREQRSRDDAAKAGRRIWTSWEYSTDIFERSTIQGMARHYLQLLTRVAADPGRRISELPLLNAEERQQMLEWSGATAGPRQDGCLHELFRERVAEAPDAVAAVFEDQRLTYGELDARSDGLARRLRALGVGPETVVGLLVERSLDMVIGILGILKSGGAYLPLEPDYPQERLAFMLRDAQASVVVTQSRLVERVPACDAEILPIDAVTPELQAEAAPTLAACPQNLAYVIYTSGSTGRPKGVMVTHACVTRLFRVTEGLFKFTRDDVWSLFHSHAFDFSVWELWGALLYGGRVVVVPRMMRRATEAFHDLLAREGVTVLSQTPSAFAQLIRADAQAGHELALRTVVFGGEALNFAELRPWVARHGDERPRLVNMYGITETTVHVTHRRIGEADCRERAKSLIGRALGDLQLYVLDPAFEPAPIGVPGELYVGGAGLGRGYLNRPAMTAERFVPSPFGNGERLYRTGDLARWHHDGELEYLGRLDHQVKIRGFRIELGEVEATLADHPDVREALVVARGDGSGGKRLVSYVVLKQDGEAALRPDEPNENLKPHELKKYLKRSLPDYMVPVAIVPLQSFPLTANGKIDRRALPKPSARPAGAEYVAPRTRVEERLAGIWSELLRVERIGINDNFFELGGHSLMGMRMMTRVRDAFGADLPLRTLFEAATVNDMAKLIQNEEWEEVSISLAESG